LPVSEPWIIRILGVGGALVLGWEIPKGNWLIFALLVAIAGIPVVVRWPVACSLGVYAFLIPFDTIAIIGGGTTGPTLTRLVGAAAGGILLVSALVRRRVVGPPVAALWWMLFLIWGATTALWAREILLVYDRLPTALSLLVVYVIAVAVHADERELSQVSVLTILGGVVAAAYAAYSFAGGVDYGGGSNRASLIMGEVETDPNQFACSLLLPLSLAFGRFLSSHRHLERLLLLGALVTIVVGLYTTMSRGSLVAVAIMVLFYLYNIGFSFRILILLAALAGSLVFLPQEFFNRLDPDMDANALSAGRMNIWRVGLDAFYQNGITGVGLSNFHTIHLEGRAPHNIYLGLLVEVGIVGVVIMMAAILSHLGAAKIWQRKSPTGAHGQILAILAACLGMLAAGFFLDIIWRKAFWLPFMLLAMSVRLATDSAKKSPA
jgi:O-antigen ligase